ncbi:iron ABC transporter permease [Kibdelosporangium philippinense]|uniref:Iron ABC transporter permease n=1 Tax=Kibdelosporangium philippinense TaxID=211113 RepID=A0ABS8ZWT8_9PSEU|nr:iron chelate uptake ABC transporter family permease subunit [Kibdelosporangium philippinense]MCE7012166.1 iron ABC transporter permease [Kibdelosporangium philippinense]
MGGRRRVLVLVGASVLAILAIFASLAVGSLGIPLGEVWRALVSPDGSANSLIVQTQRIPRTVLGVAAGVALAVAGLLMQSLTRNPLADPRIMGVSSGASLGVVIAIFVFGVDALPGFVWFGIFGAFATGLLVFSVAARTRTGSSPVTLALVGAAIDASFSAVVIAILTLDAQTFEQYRYWVIGSLTGRPAEVSFTVLPFILVGLLLALISARGLDALALGEDVAVGLGQRVAVTRFAAGAGSVLLTGAAVAAAGPIGFVGLAVPHFARNLVGNDHRWMLAVSVPLGVAFLLGADVIGRVIVLPDEIRAGVITAVLGAPILLFLVRRPRLVTA